MPVKKIYQDIHLAVDVVIFTIKNGKLHTLLIQMKKQPYHGWWAFPGGLIKKTETLDQATKRELKEKTGVANVYLEQLYTFSNVKRDPRGRVVSCAYFALIPLEPKNLHTTSKYLGVKFWPVSNLPKLAYDHTRIARYALARLRSKLEYSNIAWSLLPREFTLTELQHVYEIVLGRKLDKRNFRKRTEQLDFIFYTGHKRSGGAHRPAKLYKFRSTKFVMIEAT